MRIVIPLFVVLLMSTPLASASKDCDLIFLNQVASSSDQGFLDFNRRSGRGIGAFFRGVFGFLSRASERGPIGKFILPNEIRPYAASKILAQANGELIVTVGSERALFDYLLTPNASSLLVVDHDPGIVLFHRINSIVLRASGGSRERYLELRHAKTFETWSRLLEKAHKERQINSLDREFVLSGDSRELMSWSPEKMFEDWKVFTHQNPGWDVLLYQEKPGSTDDPFYGVNYFHEDGLFNRVYELARRGRYQVRLTNLASKSDVERVVSEIQRVGLTVAVLDLSNTWQNSAESPYLGPEKTGMVLKAFSRVAHDSGILIVTYQGPDRNQPGYYRGYYYRDLLSWQATSPEGSWADLARLFTSEENATAFYDKYRIDDPRLSDPRAAFGQTPAWAR